MRSNDPLKKELRSIHRRAWLDVQCGRNEDDDANQLCHLAGDALKALKASKKNAGESR